MNRRIDCEEKTTRSLGMGYENLLIKRNNVTHAAAQYAAASVKMMRLCG